MKIAQRGLDFELRKKFQGMEFRDFYELAAKASEYEELLREDNYRKKNSTGTYYGDFSHDIAVAEMANSGVQVCPMLVRKHQDARKKGGLECPNNCVHL